MKKRLYFTPWSARLRNKKYFGDFKDSRWEDLNIVIKEDLGPGYCGMYHPGDKEIVIYKEACKNFKMSLEEIITHELCHFFQEYFGFLSRKRGICGSWVIFEEKKFNNDELFIIGYWNFPWEKEARLFEKLYSHKMIFSDFIKSPKKYLDELAYDYLSMRDMTNE